jgi:hypothetical protein
MPILENNELNWLAAALDGEGTICVNKKNGRIQIAIYNKNFDFARKAARLMGGKVFVLHYKNKLSDGIIYSAKATRKMVLLKMLKQVEPFLVVKRKKAISAIRTILDYYDIADITLRAYPSLP